MKRKKKVIAVTKTASVKPRKRSVLELELERQLTVSGISDWVPELRFHDTRKWRFDFAWPDKMVAAEVHGGTWRGGRHTRGKGFESDCEKSNAAVLQGWRVFTFTSKMVRDGTASKLLSGFLR